MKNTNTPSSVNVEGNTILKKLKNLDFIDTNIIFCKSKNKKLTDNDEFKIYI